jgi:hypothetical protein
LLPAATRIIGPIGAAKCVAEPIHVVRDEKPIGLKASGKLDIAQQRGTLKVRLTVTAGE